MNVEAKVSLNPRVLRTVIGNRSKTRRRRSKRRQRHVHYSCRTELDVRGFSNNPQIFIVAPTGDYQKGQLANPGKNHWMFDPLLGVSYLSHKTGTEFTMFGGFAISTINPDTDYRNGDVIHLEATLQQFLPLRKETLLGSGANGFYYQQVTGDSGSGAVLGSNEGADIG